LGRTLEKRFESITLSNKHSINSARLFYEAILAEEVYPTTSGEEVEGSLKVRGADGGIRKAIL
jgi:hypothetical protein